MAVKVKIWDGFSYTQKCAQIRIVENRLKKIKDATIWLVENHKDVGKNFAGFVWGLGKNIAKKQEDIINATNLKMIKRKNKILIKRNHC